MIVGRNNIIQALQSGKALDKIFLNAKATGDPVSQIRHLA
jgi:23S rRNA (guanosine2251-2'-O)-methyltransferase